MEKNDLKGLTALKEKRKNSLRMTITVPIIIFICTASVVLAVFTVYMGYRSTISSLEDSMISAAGIAGDAVSNKLGRISVLMEEIASNSVMYSSEATDAEKAALVTKKVKEYDLLDGYILSASGKEIKTGKDYSSAEYFSPAKDGETYITSPYLDEKSGELAMTLSTPIWTNGMKGTSVTGVVCFTVPQTLIGQAISSMNISKNGYAYILDKNGDFVDYIDTAYISDGKNIFELAESEPALQPLVDSFNSALSGEVSFNQYQYQGVRKFLCASTVEGSDGWIICLTAPVSDFTRGVMTSIYGSAALLVIIILVGVFGCIYIANRVVDPLKVYIKRLSQLAAGDVLSPLPDLAAASSEFVVLKSSILNTLSQTGSIIKDIDFILSEFSGGNFDVNSHDTGLYIGDYANILTSLKTLKSGLSDSFLDILQVSEQVSAGASQVSSGSQALAQGATEQASSVQELSASIADISQRVTRNAEDAEKAKELTTSTEAVMQSSVNDMELARQAMDKISSTSKNIGKVIKTIDDIAFQTNILALNAAVEAARAGAAGKGFAVVADEVRNLSQKSAEAAKNTTLLIESSIEAVEKGSQLVSNTSTGFVEVAKKASEIVVLIDEISEQAQEQAAAINQVSIGIEQVSSVVQMNSATSEESAAASEELSSQAEVLKSLVGQFRLAT
ncbi:MAG: methyl-accepting chemotaxis protein [Oscillospiraceae bacterium]|nr:methyl-accepting chemotaxis protein [Oscillospiraceae bacterium]